MTQNTRKAYFASRILIFSMSYFALSVSFADDVTLKTLTSAEVNPFSGEELSIENLNVALERENVMDQLVKKRLSRLNSEKDIELIAPKRDSEKRRIFNENKDTASYDPVNLSLPPLDGTGMIAESKLPVATHETAIVIARKVDEPKKLTKVAPNVKAIKEDVGMIRIGGKQTVFVSTTTGDQVSYQSEQRNNATIKGASNYTTIMPDKVHNAPLAGKEPPFGSGAGVGMGASAYPAGIPLSAGMSTIGLPPVGLKPAFAQ